MANRLIPALEQVINSADVQIGSGFLLYTYQTETTTPLATYSDEALTIPNTNPIEADSTGSFGNVWVNDLSLYKIILNDADDVLVASFDPVDGENNTLTSFDPMPTVFLGTTSGDGTSYTLAGDPTLTEYLDNQSFLVTFHIASDDDATLDIDGLGALNLQKFDDDGDLINIEANDINTGQTYLLKNSGTSFAIINLQSKAATISLSGTQFLSSFITISNNGTDGDHDIDFSAGTFNFADGSGQAILSSTLTKQIDASWAEGTNAGGLFTGTVAANTWYHCFTINNPTTGISDAGFDTSITAANIPTGYTNYNYRGSILTDSSANILAFFQLGNRFELSLPINNFSGTSPTSFTLQPLSIPPDISVIAIYSLLAQGPSGSNGFIRFMNPLATDAVPTVSNSQFQAYNTVSASGIAYGLPLETSSNSNQQIAWRSSVGMAATINTFGFIVPSNILY